MKCNSGSVCYPNTFISEISFIIFSIDIKHVANLTNLSFNGCSWTGELVEVHSLQRMSTAMKNPRLTLRRAQCFQIFSMFYSNSQFLTSSTLSDIPFHLYTVLAAPPWTTTQSEMGGALPWDERRFALWSRSVGFHGALCPLCPCSIERIHQNKPSVSHNLQPVPIFHIRPEHDCAM